MTLGGGLAREALMEQFPILTQPVRKGRRLAYFDSAASSLRPRTVVEAVSQYYLYGAANVHRGVHYLSEQASELFDAARRTVADFLNAGSEEEIVFTSGTTDGINLVANTFGKERIQAGDEILLTVMEHHANIVPWYRLAEERGASLKTVPLTPRGDLDLTHLESLLTDRVKLFALTHVSNAIGTINPVKELIEMAHLRGIPVLVDGAQAAPHLKVDLAELDCDFYVFSGHKVFGPNGIGVLYGKKQHLDAMPPFRSGGGMIQTVAFDCVRYADAPQRFEAGTPNVAGAIGLAAALRFMQGLDWNAISKEEARLASYARQRLKAIDGLRMLGEPAAAIPVLSFVMDGVHAHDLGTLLDEEGVAVRSGHHCCQPLMAHFGAAASTRASMSIYNTEEDVEQLVAAIIKAKEIFA